MNKNLHVIRKTVKKENSENWGKRIGKKMNHGGKKTVSGSSVFLSELTLSLILLNRRKLLIEHNI